MSLSQSLSQLVSQSPPLPLPLPQLSIAAFARRCSFLAGTVFAATLVTGCNATTPPDKAVSFPQETPILTSPTSSSIDDPPAFHFASGDLVLGDFDPYTIGDNLFDPCAEISDAEFAAAGYEKLSDVGDERDDLGIKSCSFAFERRYENEGLMINQASFEVIEEGTPRLRQFTSSIIPNAAAFPSTRDNGVCYFAVETERGTFSAWAGTIEPEATLDVQCKKAQEILEAFYLASSTD